MFQRTAKFITANFYEEKDFMRRIFMLVEVDEMCNIFKNLLTTGYQTMKVELDDQIFCWSLPFNAHIFTTSHFY